MEDVRLLLLVAALLILAGFLEIFNIEAYAVASYTTSFFSVLLGIIIIILVVFVLWKRFKAQELQRTLIERGSKEAISVLASKIETIKNILENKFSQRNYNLLKRELKEIVIYKAYLPKILGNKSSEFLNLMNEILETKRFSKNKASKHFKKLKEILE